MQHIQAIPIGVITMDKSDVITLISATQTQDDYGRWIPRETSQNVFVQVDSITQQEFYDAGRNGFNPEFRFRMFFGDYAGQSVCEYKGLRYSIYRTYRQRNDVLELYVERQGGTNGKQAGNT